MLEIYIVLRIYYGWYDNGPIAGDMIGPIVDYMINSINTP